MKNNEQFFYLQPDQRFFDFILECKKKVKNLIGDQQFLEDEPHLTLIVGDYLIEDSKLFEELNSYIRFKPIDIELRAGILLKMILSQREAQCV